MNNDVASYLNNIRMLWNFLYLCGWSVLDTINLVSSNFQMGKDPDVRLDALIVVGDIMSEKAGRKQRKSVFFNLPFNLQDRYFFFCTYTYFISISLSCQKGSQF